MFNIQTNELLLQPLGIENPILCVLGCYKVSVYMKGTFQSFFFLETWGERKHFENCVGYFVSINKPLYFQSFEDCG